MLWFQGGQHLHRNSSHVREGGREGGRGGSEREREGGREGGGRGEREIRRVRLTRSISEMKHLNSSHTCSLVNVSLLSTSVST